jgi:hypothetical protein
MTFPIQSEELASLNLNEVGCIAPFILHKKIRRSPADFFMKTEYKQILY